MSVQAKILLTYDDAEQAGLVYQAVGPDDDHILRCRVEGRVVEADVEADSIRTVLRAVDDALASFAVSEDLLKRPGVDKARA